MSGPDVLSLLALVALGLCGVLAGCGLGVFLIERVGLPDVPTMHMASFAGMTVGIVAWGVWFVPGFPS